MVLFNVNSTLILSKKEFYPSNLAINDYLNYYSHYFRTVEINNTFYKLPSEKMVLNWLSKVPEDFVFSVKASRFITHVKKLKHDGIESFFEKIALLKKKTAHAFVILIMTKKHMQLKMR